MMSFAAQNNLTDANADEYNVDVNNAAVNNPAERTEGVQELPKSQFEELKFLISNVGKQINERIDSLEAKISSDVNELRGEDRRLAGLIRTNKENVETDIEEFKSRLNVRDEEFVAQANAQRESDEYVKFLSDKVIRLEKDSYSSQQHQRGWNVEIDGVPVNIGDEPAQLEIAAIEIFRGINVEITPDDIDTIHRLPSSRNEEPKPVIIRFRSRKHVRELHDNKSKLKNMSNLNINVAGITEQSRVYIRPSLCRYYRNLSYNCRVLKRNGMIDRVSVANDGKISIKTPDGSYLKVAHQTDLMEKFPRFQRFNFRDGPQGDD